MEEPTRRSINAEKRRGAILRYALKVFAKEGYHEADVQVIADMAKVGKGTVYRHFGNKKDLFLATGKHCVEMLGEFIRKQVGDEDDGPELIKQIGYGGVMKRVAISFAEFYQGKPQAIEIMIQERAEFRDSVFPTHLMHLAETRAGMDDLIAAGIETGEFRKMDARVVTDSYADLLFGAVVNGCLEGKRTNLVKRVSDAMDIFLHGLVVKSDG